MSIEVLSLCAAIACLAVATVVQTASDVRSAARSGRCWYAVPLRRGANVHQAAVWAALFCALAALGSISVRRGEWPLTAAAEVAVASAASALLWRLLHRRRNGHRFASPLLYVLTAGLLSWPMLLRAHSLDTWLQPWSFFSNLLLALAFGAFVEAGSSALANLLFDWRGKRGGTVARETVDVAEPEEQKWKAAQFRPTDGGTGQSASQPGFALLTASLLIRAVVGQYTRGIPWSWSALESWQAILLLWYAIHWCAFVLLGSGTPPLGLRPPGRTASRSGGGRRGLLWTLETLGLVLTFVTLSMMGR